MASVWYRGQYADEAGRSVAFRVQDVTPDLHDRLVEYYKTQFLHDEAICKHTRFAEDEVSVADYVSLQRETLKQGYSLVVLEEPAAGGEPEIVGAAMYTVHNEGDSDGLHGEGAAFRVVMAVFEAIAAAPGGDPAARGAKRYMSGLGMWVRRDRRRRGLGEAIVRAALASCRGKGVPHFSATYTGIGSQRAAAKAGLQEQAVVVYDDIVGEDGGRPLRGLPDKYCKLLGTDVDLK